MYKIPPITGQPTRILESLSKKKKKSGEGWLSTSASNRNAWYTNGLDICTIQNIHIR
jgi:hypothetical protein